MINSNYSKRLGFLVFCLAFILTMCGAAAAAVPTNTTHSNISTSANQATTSINTTTSKTTNLEVQTTAGDPQIYRNGVPVARGGHPAGYVFPTIATAITAADSGDTIMLANGATFSPAAGGLIITKNLNFNVFNNGQATINGLSTGLKPIFTIDPGITLNLQNIVLTHGQNSAIWNDKGTLILTHCTFTDNNAPNNDGGAIYNEGTCTVTNCTFTGNTATTSNGGAIYNDIGTLKVTGSTFTGNKATGTGEGGAIYNDATATLNFNQIVGNTASKGNSIYNKGGTVNAMLNWWGYNLVTNVAAQIFSNGGSVSYNPWMILTITANPASVLVGGTSIITAELLYSSNGVYHNPTLGVVPYTGSADFKTNKGSITNANFVNGKATSILTNLNTPGVATVSATVNNPTVPTNVKVTVTTPSVISTNPGNLQANVPTNTMITVTFNELIQISNISSIVLKLTNSPGTLIPISASVTGDILTIAPTTPLTPNTTYTVILHSGCVTSTTGIALTPAVSFRFTTS